MTGYPQKAEREFLPADGTKGRERRRENAPIKSCNPQILDINLFFKSNFKHIHL
jgi:hypothetical protein